MQTIRLGQSGPAVLEVRSALQVIGLLPVGEAAPDPRDPLAAVYDGACALAIRQFQQQRGLVAHGEVDEETYRELMSARIRLGDRVLREDPERRLRGDDVRELQQRVAELGFDVGNIDGIFGPVTGRGLAAFQRDFGLTADAVAGPQTFGALAQLGSKVVGGSAAHLRSRAARLASGPTLGGKTVVLDPTPASDPAYLDDSSSIVWDVAERLQARLNELGVHAVMAATRGAELDSASRAALANEQQADLFLRITVATHASTNAEGLAAYYFGTSEQAYSLAGQEFASLLRREISARTPFIDLGAHPRSLEVLRLTSMPAVCLEIGYLSNRLDAERLYDDSLREVITEGAIAAIQRYYLDSPNDFQTGTWRLPPELRTSRPT
ncbi:N-acetylmuramoyl-L-alanine amidase [Epidermidibacterium keratini]|uniref:N-acetylmuramoyl-L-alanine amidase n=1 Tax=Epidermidibacterium keratini TaxID=1891644 RepID=A0A7L4YMW1_9ACTN|nr:peptidoglycan-binding protein [Epidermidibacterium keratini]QHC00486.1 N-acetylmuramoyl-L-alanine amidase [Epidermidibacterium keratini]